MRNPGLEEAQAGIKIAKRNTNNLRYADDTTLLAVTADGDSSHEIKRLLLLGRKVMTNLLVRQHIKKQRHYFVNKGPFSQGYGFSSGHV